MFYFAFLFFQALFKIWISNKFKIILVILISDFLSYSIVPHYTQFIYYYTHKIFEVMVGATLMKNLVSPVPKQSGGVFRKIKISKHESFCGLSNRFYKYATCFSTQLKYPFIRNIIRGIIYTDNLQTSRCQEKTFCRC